MAKIWCNKFALACTDSDITNVQTVPYYTSINSFLKLKSCVISLLLAEERDQLTESLFVYTDSLKFREISHHIVHHQA